ncbi:MAG: TIGR00730 family Rossman fold protein [Legionella sp.]|nr:TIGR00730 family Rossman fold protein [Legionella sp.]
MNINLMENQENSSTTSDLSNKTTNCKVPINIGVYLGSSIGDKAILQESVVQFGKGLARLGYTLVYGGASIGLMGILASTVKENGGKVIAIITKHLESKEILFKQADEIYIVSSMHERKNLIREKSSQFIVFPGGLGTFDELFETWCLIKVGSIKKNMGLMNICGFFNPLFELVTHAKKNGFLTEVESTIPSIYSDVAECLLDMAYGKTKELYGLC